MRIECSYCKSKDITKYGIRKNKWGKVQLYKCKCCSRTFSQNTTFSKMKHKGEIITTAIDLYFKNVSLRKIEDHLKQAHGVNVTHVTILNWVRKYSAIVGEFTANLKVEGSETILADEMMVSVKGDWVWFWSVMDKRTKFITSTCLSRTRGLPEAVGLFKKAKTRTKNIPKTVVTDGLPSYMRAFTKNFWRHRARHMRLVKFWDKVNNNPIERYHGTVRERTKIMRGFKEMGSANDIMGGFINYYNFVRPHMSLGGLTPAEAAGINLGLSGGNRWNKLIKIGVDYKNGVYEIPKEYRTGHKHGLSTTPKPFIVRIFDKHGNEIEPKELGYKRRFESREKAETFVRFYKMFDGHYRFEIEER